MAKDKKIDLFVTDKPEREGYGYGVKNMAKVVEKYRGSISWEVAGGLMKVEIFLPVDRNNAYDKNQRLEQYWYILKYCYDNIEIQRCS